MKRVVSFIFVLLLSISAVIAQENQTNQSANTTQPPVPQIMCSDKQCDSGCVRCIDKNCHDPGFICTEEVTLDKFFPEEIPLGANQINIVLKNTGTVDLSDVYALISGDGIETTDKIPLAKLKAGDKDYVFAKINAAKNGTIDIVIKLYYSGNLKQKYAEQITVLNPEAPKTVEPEFNVTGLTNSLNQLKQRYKELEALYQDKNSQGYPVDIVYDKLRTAATFITQTEANLFGGDYRSVQVNLGVLNTSLNDIEDQLDSAKKQEVSFQQKIKNNLLFYGSLAAAIVSIFTAYRLVQESVDKKKLIELQRKFRSSKGKARKEIKKQIVEVEKKEIKRKTAKKKAAKIEKEDDAV